MRGTVYFPIASRELYGLWKAEERKLVWWGDFACSSTMSKIYISLYGFLKFEGRKLMVGCLRMWKVSELSISMSKIRRVEENFADSSIVSKVHISLYGF